LFQSHFSEDNPRALSRPAVNQTAFHFGESENRADILWRFGRSDGPASSPKDSAIPLELAIVAGIWCRAVTAAAQCQDISYYRKLSRVPANLCRHSFGATVAADTGLKYLVGDLYNH